MIKDLYKKYFVQNLANFITVLGLIGAIWLLVICISNPEQLWLILILTSGVGLTDFVDGLMARYLKIESKFGSALDRLRDKVFICPLMIILVWHYYESLKTLSIVVITLTISLVSSLVLIEVLLFIAWLIGLIKKLDVSSNRYGRIKMFLEFLIVIFWLFSLTIKKYFGFHLFRFSIYLIDLILFVAIYFAIRSLDEYYKRYSNKGIKNRTKK